MKRALILVAVGAAIWLAAKDAAYTSYLRWGELTQPAELDFSNPEYWAMQPVEKPAGAWEKPWGIDAFVVLPPANVPASPGLLDPNEANVLSTTMKSLRNMTPAIPGETPVYAPLYRAPSAVSDSMVRQDLLEFAELDLSTSFEYYLSEINQGRGIMLIVAEDAQPFITPLIARLQQDDLAARFAGLIVFGKNDNSASYSSLICADILNGACQQDVKTKAEVSLLRFVTPNFAGPPTGTQAVDQDGVATALKTQAENVSVWLDETQPKPAEPFFAVQVIEDAPVYRVGESTPIENTDDQSIEDKD